MSCGSGSRSRAHRKIVLSVPTKADGRPFGQENPKKQFMGPQNTHRLAGFAQTSQAEELKKLK